jgi:hypothetical protein
MQLLSASLNNPQNIERTDLITRCNELCYMDPMLCIGCEKKQKIKQPLLSNSLANKNLQIPRVKEESAATALSIVLASAHIQMT